MHNHLFNARKKLHIRKTAELFRISTKEDGVQDDNIRLTRRWREVFEAYIGGLTDRSIAEQLGIGYSAVRRHKERMRDANDCNSMRELGSLFQSGHRGEEKTHES